MVPALMARDRTLWPPMVSTATTRTVITILRIPTTRRIACNLPQLIIPARLPLDKAKVDKVPSLVLYVAAGDGIGKGKVYQVEGQDGRVLGKANLDNTPTGITMYRDKGVVVSIPRDGGRDRGN